MPYLDLCATNNRMYPNNIVIKLPETAIIPYFTLFLLFLISSNEESLSFKYTLPSENLFFIA